MNEQTLQSRYEIQRQLGKKAGRRTLLARDSLTQHPVIIKLLTFSSDFAWEDLKFFEREAETLKTLDHPAIPKYVDFFELETGSKGYALVQSYVNGQSLEEYIKSGRIFTEKELKNIAKQLLEILIYLHAQYPPVIHRDIKPSNIILVEDPSGLNDRLYLVDFGSVQTLASKAGKTVTVVGTYGYMPPEQFGGSATPASDLYSLGATIIALATGIHPADLPQEDTRIGFEELVNLSPSFADWLRWLTEPSLERRLSKALEALDVLENGQTKLERASVNTSLGQIIERVNPWFMFGVALVRSGFLGGGFVTLCATLYSSVVFPVAGTTMGMWFGAMIGFPLGFTNGILIGLITRLFFFPLRNINQHRRVLNLFSTMLGTAAATAYFGFMIFGTMGFRSSGLQQILFFLVAPSIITGLSMGAVSKSFAQWYEQLYRIKRLK